MSSAGGCSIHHFSDGYNKFYKSACKLGSSGIPQPLIPTEKEYESMTTMKLVSVYEFKNMTKAGQQTAADLVGEAAEPADLVEDEDDERPWELYEIKTYKSKAPGRKKTKDTQGKKKQPVRKRN